MRRFRWFLAGLFYRASVVIEPMTSDAELERLHAVLASNYAKSVESTTASRGALDALAPRVATRARSV